MAELIISTDKNGFVKVPLTTYKGYQETILQNIPDGEQEVVTKREISDFANAIISKVNDNIRTFINTFLCHSGFMICLRQLIGPFLCIV